MSKKSVRLIMILLALLLLCLSACGQTQQPSAAPQPTDQQPATPQSSEPESPPPAENPWTKNYPNKTVTIIVPSAAGSGYDTMARKLAEVLPTYMNNVTVYVENLSAGSGAEGWAKLSGATPDGYTLCFYGVANCWVTQKMYDLPYDIESLTPLCTVTNESGQLSVAPNSDIQTLDDFLAKYKDTGAVPLFSTTSAGSATHTQALAVMSILGINPRFVHYGGTGEAVSGLTRKETEFFYIAYETALSYLESDMMRSMVILGSEHQEPTPDVPTIYEINGVTEEQAKKIELLTTSHRAMWAPPGMDQELRDMIVDILEQAFADPRYLEWAESIGRRINFVGGDEAGAIMQGSYEAQSEFIDLFISSLGG